MKRLILWLRDWFMEPAALVVAQRAESHCVLIGNCTDELSEQIEKLHRKLALLAGPSPASDGLSLAELRNQICDLQKTAQQHEAKLRACRDEADRRGQRIAELESLLNVQSQHVSELFAKVAHFEDKFAARTDFMCTPSLN